MRWWALHAFSFLMRGVGVLCVLFSLVAIATLVYVDLQAVQARSSEPIYQLAFGLTYFTYQFWALMGIFIGLGWYAGGQLLSLLIAIEYNTRRVADRADAAQRRRLGIAPARPQDVRFWDEQIAAQRDNPPAAPPPNRTPPSRPVRGESPRYRVQFNRDPAPRAKSPRFNQADDPTDGDRYTYGREGKRNTE